MKTFLLSLVLAFTAGLAYAQEPSYDLTQLKADKVFVLKQEAIKLQRMMEKTGLAKVKKSLTTCPPEVDIDIDIDTTPTGVDANCEARWSDGSCRTWGADQRGTCYPNCEARWSDGTCRTWGADICM